MRIGRILFLGIFLLSLTTILAVSSFFEQRAYSALHQLSLADSANASNQQQELKSKYKQDVLDLLKNYQEKKISASQLEESLFALNAPVAYKDLHFQLSTTLAELNSSRPPLAEIKGKLENLKNRYSWLTANLTIFLANIL
ncbi:MAG: hypothetical protein WCV73_00475 [Patescibacteria group bacterium]|jgi:hypothetical protein